MNYRSIEIDFEIHKAIENERRGFDEHPNVALRRLLKLEPQAMPSASLDQAESGLGKNWARKGVVLPNGTKLRMTYNNKAYQGSIQDGAWVIDGQTFDSPSGAASGVGRTSSGKETRLDGWKYWEVFRPSEKDWVQIDTLRRRKITLEELGLDG